MALSLAKILQVGFASFMGLGFIALSIITLIPDDASKLNRLGYYSVCSFTPFSTGLLLVFSAVSLLFALKKYRG